MDIDTHTDLETKAGIPLDAMVTHGEMMRAFEAFKETGNHFDPATAKRLRDYVYSAGNLRDPAEAYKAFRGRLPTIDALLKKRGLDTAAA